jgi:hypothetical protein
MTIEPPSVLDDELLALRLERGGLYRGPTSEKRNAT